MYMQLLTMWLHHLSLSIRANAGDKERGQGLIEYALILILVSLVMVVLLTVLGPGIRNVFENIIVNVGAAADS